MITAYTQSGFRTSFKPKCDHLDDFILGDDLASQNLQGSTFQPRSQDDSLEEGPVNYITAALRDDSDEDPTESDFICVRFCMGEA